jgi:hypothetical protein
VRVAMPSIIGFISGWISTCRTRRSGACVIGLAAILIVCASASNTSAQTVTCSVSPCSIQTNKPFQAQADHDGIDTDSYRLYVNGQLIATLPVANLTGGVISFSLSGLAKGTYTLFIEAAGEGGVTASDTLTVVATPGKPKKPLGIRIVTSG